MGTADARAAQASNVAHIEKSVADSDQAQYSQRETWATIRQQEAEERTLFRPRGAATLASAPTFFERSMSWKRDQTARATRPLGRGMSHVRFYSRCCTAWAARRGS